MLMCPGCFFSDQCIDDLARALPSFEYLEEISLKGEFCVFLSSSHNAGWCVEHLNRLAKGLKDCVYVTRVVIGLTSMHVLS